MEHEDKELAESKPISYSSASYPLSLRQDKTDPQTIRVLYISQNESIHHCCGGQ